MYNYKIYSHQIGSLTNIISTKWSQFRNGIFINWIFCWLFNNISDSIMFGRFYMLLVSIIKQKVAKYNSVSIYSSESSTDDESNI